MDTPDVAPPEAPTHTGPPPITRLRELRLARNISQLHLAANGLVSLGVLAQLERATSDDQIQQVGVGKIIRLAAQLGVSPVELYPRLGER